MSDRTLEAKGFPDGAGVDDEFTCQIQEEKPLIKKRRKRKKKKTSEKEDLILEAMQKEYSSEDADYPKFRAGFRNLTSRKRKKRKLCVMLSGSASFKPTKAAVEDSIKAIEYYNERLKTEYKYHEALKSNTVTDHTGGVIFITFEACRDGDHPETFEGIIYALYNACNFVCSKVLMCRKSVLDKC